MSAIACAPTANACAPLPQPNERSGRLASEIAEWQARCAALTTERDELRTQSENHAALTASLREELTAKAQSLAGLQTQADLEQERLRTLEQQLEQLREAAAQPDPEGDRLREEVTSLSQSLEEARQRIGDQRERHAGLEEELSVVRASAQNFRSSSTLIDMS